MVTHTLPMPAPVLPKETFEQRHPISADLADDRFVAAMLETPFCKTAHRNPLEWVASFLLHALIISTLLMIPLYFTDSLDLRAFTTTFLVGPPPPAPPPPASPAAKLMREVPKERFMQSGRLTAPVAIPRQIAMVKEDPIPDTGTDGVIGGVPGGIPGGQIGGVLGGIIGGAATSRLVPAMNVPPPPPKRILKVGGNVKPPRLIFQPELMYPAIARNARVQGSVRIDAILDESGNVIQAHVVDGPALLVASAMSQVTQWKYEPTLLNGQPVSVEMIIYVNYRLE